MRYQGKITHWKDEQGFGFITPKTGGEQVFVHIKSFSDRQQRPAENQTVVYELKTDAKGRLQAENVGFVGERVTSAASSGYSNISLIIASAFLVSIAGLAWAGKLPVAVPGFYSVASIVAFVAYALDKSAAQKDEWRTAETTLHFFALIGGWPGALAAQRLLRHKSKKLSFQIVFWITVVLNCIALGGLFSAFGAEILNSILSLTWESKNILPQLASLQQLSEL